MNRKEITNSQDYKATKAAMKYWHSLPEEYKARINNLGPEPDVIDAYEEGVLYGWNHPNWISVEEELPKCNIVDCGLATYPVLVYREDGFIDISRYDSEVGEWDCVGVVTHWMPLPQPPRKEE